MSQKNLKFFHSFIKIFHSSTKLIANDPDIDEASKALKNQSF